MRINNSRAASTFAAENKRQPMKRKFRKNLMKSGLVTTIICVGEREYCFLIDSGSSQNSVTEEVLKDNEAFSKVVAKTSVYGVDGIPSDYNLIEMQYRCASIVSSDQFFVMSSKVFQAIEEETGIKLRGILGNPFLFKHKAVIDYSTMELRIPRGKRVLEARK